MKKSQLIKIIKEVIEESATSRLHQEIWDSIEMLIEAGATFGDIRDVIDQMEKESGEEPEGEEYYDKNGRPDTNGLYDAGGHAVRHPGEVFGE